jgi:hypothetical protein
LEERYSDKNPMIRFVLIFCCFCSCIHIERIPSAKIDDGYSTLSSEEKIKITLASQGYNNGSISMAQWIEAKDLAAMVSKKTWVIIWASWCPHSGNLLEQKFPFYSDSLKGTVDIMLIAQNINLDYQRKTLKSINYSKPLYIINSDKYGTNEKEKVVKFLKELNIQNDLISHSTPINLLLDSNGKVLRIKYGERITGDFFK